MFDLYLFHHIMNETDGQIPLEYFYLDDTLSGKGTHFRYTQKEIDDMEITAKKHVDKIKKAIDHFAQRNWAQEALVQKLRKTDWLHFALLNHTESIEGKRVVVVGSISPWVETLLLAVGASSVTTVEVLTIYMHPQLLMYVLLLLRLGLLFLFYLNCCLISIKIINALFLYSTTH